MSIRVYALAKELQVDNKSLMGLCSSIGIIPKGKSALASISDEDAVKVKAHVLHGQSADSEKTASHSAVTPLTPPRTIVTGRIPTLPSKPRRSEKNTPAKVEKSENEGANENENASASADGIKTPENAVSAAGTESVPSTGVQDVRAEKTAAAEVRKQDKTSAAAEKNPQTVNEAPVCEAAPLEKQSSVVTPSPVVKTSDAAAVSAETPSSVSKKEPSAAKELKAETVNNVLTPVQTLEIPGEEHIQPVSVVETEKNKNRNTSIPQPAAEKAVPTAAPVSAPVLKETASEPSVSPESSRSRDVSAVRDIPEEKASENSVSAADATHEKTHGENNRGTRPGSAARTADTAAAGRRGRGETGGKENKDGGRSDRRRTPGNGPLSKKIRKDNRPEEAPRSRGLSVAEEIARQAQSDAPIRPTFDNSFPTLQNARTIRQDAGKNTTTRREERHPGLRLAPLPVAKTPVLKKTPEEESVKPEVRLTPEEIQRLREGDKSIVRRMEQEFQEKNRSRDAVSDEHPRSKDGRDGKDGKDGRDGRGTRERSGERPERSGERTDRGGERGERTDRGPRTDRGDRTDRGPRPDRPSGDRSASTDKRPRRPDNKGTGRMAPVPVAVPEESGKPGAKKLNNKSRNVLNKRASELETVPARDSRFNSDDKRGRSRRFSLDDDDEFGTRVRWKKQKNQPVPTTTAPRKSSYVLQLPLTVRSFAEGVGLTAAKVLAKLMMDFGMPLTITSPIDETTAQLLADAFGIPVDIRPEVTLEERLIGDMEEAKDDPEKLVSRPPVVTFLGHVDHGKTSLLDRIINIDVVSGEKGGITQHIRAYNVKYHDKSVTFVDTPGHEAFTEMRARGANTTDIAVIVVAADDGVMPQTEEAISHARAAGVPIIVALNKIDLPGVNELRILQELAANNLTPSEWGGDVEVIRCSALTGQGIDDLMETILMVAELQEYRANPDRPANGVCVESSVQQGRGVVAKLLVQNGTLHTGDVIVCGATYGRVKAMVDTLIAHQKYQSAGPAIPVNVLGLDDAPGAGDKFYVLEDIANARRLAEERAEEERLSQLAGTVKAHVTLEGLFDSLGSKEVKTVNIILRTDVRGSIEAIKKELGKLEHPEVQISILQASVGGITEADVQLANASDAIIIGFNVVPDENARVLAEQKGVQIRRYDIIYQLTADVKAAMEGLLAPEEHEKELGRALVQKTFQITKVGTVAGCRVLSGTIPRDCKIRIIRNNRVIGTYSLDTLKREKDDVKEVRDGLECGMRLAGFNDVKDGDIFEAFQIESVARTF